MPSHILKAFLILLICTVGAGIRYIYKPEVNSLKFRGGDLKDHVINTEASKYLKKVILLGASEISGQGAFTDSVDLYLNQLIPADRKIFNFGVPGGGIFSDLRLLFTAESYHPELVMIGLIEQDFTSNIPPFRVRLLKDMLDEIRPRLDERQWQTIENSQNWQAIGESAVRFSEINNELYNITMTRVQQQLNFLVYSLKRKIYGPLFDTDNMSPEAMIDFSPKKFSVLRVLDEIAQKNNIRTVYYLAPHFDAPHDPNYQGFRMSINAFAAENKISITDFSESLPSTAVYFRDRAHRTPEGNEVFAKVLYRQYFENTESRKH